MLQNAPVFRLARGHRPWPGSRHPGRDDEGGRTRASGPARSQSFHPLRAGRPWVRPVALVCLLLTGGLNAAEPEVDSGSVPRSEFVGSQACAECHAEAYQAWRGSHHDLAMTEPTEDTVLGDFGDAELTAHGVTSRFFRRDGGWFANTDGPDGKLHDYPIAYTFGWYPLQQYLIAFPGGRLQALGLAWDSRPSDEGGQRWFHLYPDEAEMGPDNPLHWTASDQTWNYQCAECHSTGLDKGYDLSSNRYATTWAEIDVACEACHGPASSHVAQAKAVAAGAQAAWSDDKGLEISLGDSPDIHWITDAETGLPRRSTPRTDHTETELCARCHSRRGQIHAWESPGKPLGDTHQLALLEPGLYHADGQILDEVFVHGSFLQSRMYAAGVTCSDCHEPHSLSPKRDGDEVCAQCHPASRYANAGHHHHPTDSAGAACIGCHMPQRDYMVVDARADHSMRVPRPDLSIEIGTPNACNGCHADQDAEWAVATMTEWYGGEWAERPHYGEAIAAGRSGEADAPGRLLALAADADQPGIARATAVELLVQRLEPGHLQHLPALLADTDPLVRRAAVGWLDAADVPLRYRYGMPMLDDPDRSVRLAAARALAPLSRYELPEPEQAALTAALEAYEAAQRLNADRPESHLNVGLAEMAQGKVAKARKAYQRALTLDPAFVPAYANLADLYRALGSDAEAEETLRAGLEKAPGSAALHHALGLLHIRQKQPRRALQELRKAQELAPNDARYAYVYALALDGQGERDDALSVLTAANEASPADRDILIALVTINRDAGNKAAAAHFASSFRRHWPQDPEAKALFGELER